MSHRLILYFKQGLNSERLPFVLYEDNSIVAEGSEPIEQLAKRVREIADFNVTAIVPGEQVTSLLTSVPEGSRRHLQQALPYLLEEDLASPVETLHIVSSTKADQDGKLLCAIIDKQLLKSYLNMVEEQGLKVSSLIPDYWCLPKLDVPSLAKNEERLFIRLPTDEGMVLPRTTSDSQLQALVPAIQPEISEIAEWSPTTFIDQAPCNLLQGQFAPASKNNNFGLLKPSAAAAGVCLVLLIGYFLGAGWYFNKLADNLSTQSESRYRTLFPNDKKLFNIRSQMQAHLNQNDSNEGGALFFELLNAFANSIQSQTEPAEVRNIRFDLDNEALQLELQTSSLNFASSLQKTIQQQGIMADVLSANTNSEGVIARLRLQRQAGQ